MSSNKEAYIRYKIIDQAVTNKRKPFPRMEDLIEMLEDKLGKPFSVSTIQKDIKAMKEDELLGMHAPIRYSKSKEGYYYTDPEFSINKLPLSGDESELLSETLNFLEIVANRSISDEAKGAIIKLKNHLTPNKHRGTNTLSPVVSQRAPQQWGFFHYEALLKHITRNEVITMVYYSLKDNEMNFETVHPYQLLEFDHKWFLLGYSESKKALRVYGLERIMPDWDIMKKIKFNDSKKSQLQKYLKDMFGVYPIPGAKKQVIEFYVSKSYDYMLSMNPLHESQKIKDISHELITLVSINVIPTHELIHWFLANCENVIVDTANIKQIIKDIAKQRFERNVIQLKNYK